MHYSIRGRAAMVAAVMTLPFTGCADSGPTAVLVKPTATPNVMTLDVDAGRYRLDIGTRELWHPDGRVVDLTVDETEMLATEFAAQRALAATAAFTATAYTDADDECDWHTEVCEDAMLRADDGRPVRRAPGSQTASASVAPPYLQQPGGILDVSLRGAPGDFERTYGRIKIRISRNRPTFALNAPDAVVVEFQEGWSCEDVLDAMVEARAEAERRRHTVGSLLSTVFGWIGFTIKNGVLRGVFGAGERGAVEDAVEAMETNRVHIALSILQGLYRHMECGSVSAGSVPPEGLPPGWEWNCTEVWGTIFLSFNQFYTGWSKECKLLNAN
jgi:hypothetical protein